MADKPKPKPLVLTFEESAKRIEATRRQLLKVAEGRSNRAANAAAVRPAPSPPRNPFNPYGFGDLAPPQTPANPFAAWAEHSAGAPRTRPPPPRRSATVIRETQTSPRYVVGYGTVMPRRYSLPGDPPPRVVYRPEEVKGKPYDKDMRTADFLDMAKTHRVFEPRRGDRLVIGTGAAQGRMIPMALARVLGGYVDPVTGKTMVFPGDHAASNARLDRYGSEEMMRRAEVMQIASIQRGLQSPAEQRTWAGVRGGLDGAAFDGFAPVVETGAQWIDGRGRLRDLYAAAKYQVAQDEIEHPVVRNGAKIAAALVTPSPLGKGKAGAMAARIGKEMAYDAATGAIGGGLTADGDLDDRLHGALVEGVESLAFGRLADGAGRVIGRELDRAAPELWRRAIGFDMPATHLTNKAAHGDNTTLNGLAMRAADEVQRPTGPYMAGLNEAYENTLKARSGGMRVIPSATDEGRFFRPEVSRLDQYSLDTLSEALAADPKTLDQMILGYFLESQRRRTGEPLKRAGAEAADGLWDYLTDPAGSPDGAPVRGFSPAR